MSRRFGRLFGHNLTVATVLIALVKIGEFLHPYSGKFSY